MHLSRNYTKKDDALVSTPITLSEDDDDFEHGNGSSDKERDDFQMVVSELEESPNAAEKNAGICRNRNRSFHFLKERRQTHTERDRAHHRYYSNRFHLELKFKEFKVEGAREREEGNMPGLTPNFGRTK